MAIEGAKLKNLTGRQGASSPNLIIVVKVSQTSLGRGFYTKH